MIIVPTIIKYQDYVTSLKQYQGKIDDAQNQYNSLKQQAAFRKLLIQVNQRQRVK